MILLKLLAIAVIFIGTVNSDISTGDDNFGKIINGRDANEGEFPYQVQILERGSHKCAGSMVDEYHIITTAASIKRASEHIEDYSILAGALYKDDYNNPHSQSRKFSKIYVHKDYHSNNSGAYNDIAIGRLDRGFNIFTDFIKPIPLNKDIPKEVKCSVTGWGVTHRMDKTLEVRKGIALQVLEATLIPGEHCKKFGTVVPDGTLCANYTEKGGTPCFGDGGGALACEGKLMGIASFTFGCIGTVRPSFYTDIFYFKGWIDMTIKESYTEIDDFC